MLHRRLPLQDVRRLYGCLQRDMHEEEVAQARMKVEKLDQLADHVLRDCLRDPWIANGLRTLQGMATGTCIYNIYDQ